MIQAISSERITILNSNFDHNRVSVINDVGTELIIQNTSFLNMTVSTNSEDSNILKVLESKVSI
jgi:hypothetical protein